MENTIVSKLMGMTVDEQLAFIDQLNDSSQSESIEFSIKPYMVLPGT